MIRILTRLALSAKARGVSFGRYLTRIAAWLSQGVNCIALAGHHDMTVSARCYIRRQKRGWRLGYRLFNAVFFWQENHCHSSFTRDLEFARHILILTKD